MFFVDRPVMCVWISSEARVGIQRAAVTECGAGTSVQSLQRPVTAQQRGGPARPKEKLSDGFDLFQIAVINSGLFVIANSLNPIVANPCCRSGILTSGVLGPSGRIRPICII